MRTRILFVLSAIGESAGIYLLLTTLAGVVVSMVLSGAPASVHAAVYDFWHGPGKFLHPFDQYQPFLLAWVAYMGGMVLGNRAKSQLKDAPEMAVANARLIFARAAADHQFFHDAANQLVAMSSAVDADASQAESALSSYKTNSAAAEATRTKTMGEANAEWQKMHESVIALYKPNKTIGRLISAGVVIALLAAGFLMIG